VRNDLIFECHPWLDVKQVWRLVLCSIKRWNLQAQCAGDGGQLLSARQGYLEGSIAAGRWVSEVTRGASTDVPKSREPKKVAGPGT
jgi:hypothetical protein